MRSRRLSLGCTAAGSVLLLLGILAGLVNHHVLDGPRFASHVDSMRRDPALTSQIGRAITNRVLIADPDLVALRPLIEAAATSLAGSPAFSPVVTESARQTHAFFTDENSHQFAVRLANLGSVLGGVLPALAPDAAHRIPPQLSVTLASVGSQSIAARTIRLTHLAAMLAWLLPLLALLAFGAGVFLASDRVRAMIRTGYGIACAGLGIAVLWVIGSLVAGAEDTSSLHGALVTAAWNELGSLLWWAAALTAAAGALLAAAASARVPEVDIAVLASRVWWWVAHRPQNGWLRAARAIGLLGVGLGCILQPTTMVRILVLVAGWVLLLSGVGELAAIAGARRPEAGDRGTASGRWVPVVVSVTAVSLLVGFVAFIATPAGQQVRTLVSSSTACEGSVELCDRPYDEVAFAATHNSMAAADEPRWFIPEQPTGIVGQLHAGIRAFLIDTWYGQKTENTRLVATARRSYDAALAEAKAAFGPEVVASALRLRESITQRTGPPTPYMCHGLCETGATALEPTMARVRDWLAANPREVLTFIIEDNVTPADTAAVFRRAGLMPYVYTHRVGQPWPTLGEMVDSGRRLVVMMERHGGGSTYPWLLSAFDSVQDTAYSNPTVASLSCDLNRGSRSDPLFMINNWIASFTTLVSSARTVNAYSQLMPYVERCRSERGQIPNYIAVNYYNEGDLFRVVNQLNGVR